MAIELAEGTISPDNLPENRRERLFRRIDAKAEVIAELREKIDSQPVPLWSDPVLQIIQENQNLRSIINLLEEKFPDDYKAYVLREGLGDELFALENGEDVDIDYETAKREYYALEDENEDIDFIEFVAEGVEGLIERRKKIRGFQVQWGEPNENGFYQHNLQRFEDLPEIKEGVGRYITRVSLGRYSINIFIDAGKYDEVDEYHELIRSAGLHFGDDSLINVIRDDGYNDQSLGFDQLSPKLEEYIRHEELHSIEDSFANTNPDFIYLSKAVKAKLEQVRKEPVKPEKQDPQMSAIDSLFYFNDNFPVTEIDLTDLPESSHEELIAEMYSKKRRSDIPSSTYAHITDMKALLLEEAQNDDKVEELGINILKRPLLATSELRKRFKSLYHSVFEHIPHKAKQVDALFVFIMPTQLSLIEKTVDRWIEENRSLDNQVL